MEAGTLVLVLISLCVCIFFGCLTRYLADNKGYSGGFWWGFFLNLIGLFVVAMRHDRRSDKQPDDQEVQPRPAAPSHNASGIWFKIVIVVIALLLLVFLIPNANA